jgi:hypothetical protein
MVGNSQTQAPPCCWIGTRPCQEALNPLLFRGWTNHHSLGVSPGFMHICMSLYNNRKNLSLALSRWPMFNDSWLGKEASTESFRRPLLTFCSMTDKRQSRRTQCNSTSRDILPRWTSKGEGPVALCHCIFLCLLRLRWPNNKMRSYTFTNTIDLNNNNVSFAFLPDLLIYFNVAFWDHQLITHQSFFLHLWP